MRLSQSAVREVMWIQTALLGGNHMVLQDKTSVKPFGSFWFLSVLIFAVLLRHPMLFMEPEFMV